MLVQALNVALECIFILTNTMPFIWDIVPKILPFIDSKSEVIFRLKILKD